MMFQWTVRLISTPSGSAPGGKAGSTALRNGPSSPASSQTEPDRRTIRQDFTRPSGATSSWMRFTPSSPTARPPPARPRPPPDPPGLPPPVGRDQQLDAVPALIPHRRGIGGVADILVEPAAEAAAPVIPDGGAADADLRLGLVAADDRER